MFFESDWLFHRKFERLYQLFRAERVDDALEQFDLVFVQILFVQVCFVLVCFWFVRCERDLDGNVVREFPVVVQEFYGRGLLEVSVQNEVDVRVSLLLACSMGPAVVACNIPSLAS